MPGKIHIRKRKWGFVLVFVLLVSSCSTALKTTNEVIKPMDAARVLRKVNREAPKYRSYQIDRASIVVDDGETKNSFSGQIRIDKDKQALVTVRKMNMPLARAYMSPDSLKMVNYIDRSYIRDDVGVLRYFLGFNLEYEVLQALFTADATSFIRKLLLSSELKSDIDSSMYRINSFFYPLLPDDALLNTQNHVAIDSTTMMSYSAWIDPKTFVVRKLLIRDGQNKQDITVLYDNYRKVGRSFFPQTASVIVDTAMGRLSLGMKMSRLNVNKARDFDLNIPSRYDEMKFSRN
ncbi:MAG: DUF4292 domain-containing protein [Prolixibacteraceae bacterium]|nr:DUF4292 domain-containing protein [Prolixibacteraceae bacterium]MBN2648310.1 DUF4292 domain-containing protein [Prolixibacteraceae bacterium]